MTSPNNLNNQLDSPTYKNVNIKEKLRNSLKMKKSGNLLNNNTVTTNFSNNNNEEKINNYNSDYMSGDEDPETINKNINKEKNGNIKKKKSINKTAEKEKTKKSCSKLNEAIDNTNNKGPLSSNSTVLRSNKSI